MAIVVLGRAFVGDRALERPQAQSGRLVLQELALDVQLVGLRLAIDDRLQRGLARALARVREPERPQGRMILSPLVGERAGGGIAGLLQLFGELEKGPPRDFGSPFSLSIQELPRR